MSDRPLTLLLVDNDPIFRLGLVTALSHYSDLQVIAQTDNLVEALNVLASQAIGVTLVALNLLEKTPNGWENCQQIKQTYSTTKLFLLSYTFSGEQLKKIQTLGIEGYSLKGVAIDILVEQLRQVAMGQQVWQAIETRNLSPVSALSSKSWLLRWRESGFAQIDANLTPIKTYLNCPQLSWWEWFYWSGRKRELTVARWLISQLLPVEVVVSSTALSEANFVVQPTQSSPLIPMQNTTEMGLFLRASHFLAIYNHTLTLIETSSHQNLTETPLEIDILRPDKKQELLTLILKQLNNYLEELNFIEVISEKMPESANAILEKVWRESCLHFIGKYCFAKAAFNFEDIEDILDTYEPSIKTDILNKIPLFSMLLQDLLLETNWIANQVVYPTAFLEELSGEEPLLHHAIIQLSNAVMSLILNQFSDKESVRQQLFIQEIISSREIARFRNSLSWQYQKNVYWQEPNHIFESKYILFFLSKTGLQSTDIYVPRQAELQHLTGIRWAVTILLETRDAVSPLLRSLIGFIGKGVVYLLTQVIGRGIGLIGRGIFQGLGNTLQETRYRKNRSKRDW